MRIAILLPYLNPHVMPFVDELFKLNKDLIIGVEKPFLDFRPYLMEKDYSYLPIYNLFIDNKEFMKMISNYSVGISLGLFHSITALSFARLFTRGDRKFFLMSETEHELNTNIFKRNLKRIFKLVLTMNNFNLLAIGGEHCFNYYKSIGLKPRNGYNFGYYTYNKFEFRHKFESEDMTLNLIVVAQLIERKNIILVLKALLKTSQEIQKKIKLTIVGDGYLRSELENFSKKLISEVKFTGNISDNLKVQRLIRESDFLILPSFFDGWGAVINEAVSNGCGLLISNKVYAGRELLKEGENGFSFDPDDSKCMSEILTKLTMMNKIQVKSYGIKSLKIASLWSGKIAAERFFLLLDSDNKMLWDAGPFSKKYF